MMHGRGKSDSAIVAVKPTNKAERSAAEPVEPRAETKGNADQQSTYRAQNRISVSQALDCMRQALAVWTRGRSRMRESCTYGSVRGALSNERPYRDRRQFMTLLGGAAAWPIVAWAQQPAKLATIGLLGGGSAAQQSKWTAAFLQRLQELGWIEGRNIAIEYRWTEGSNERAAEFAAELVRLKVDLIVTSGTPIVLATKRATSVIPIIFAAAADPLGGGLVASLARPGGNVTGLSLQSTDLAGKRLGLLREVVPGLNRLAVMANVDSPASVVEMSEAQAAARTLGLETATFEIRRTEDFAAAFETMKTQAQGLYVVTNPFMTAHRVRINTLALSIRLPTIHAMRDYVEVGGLMCYGASFPDLWRRAGDYVDKVLRGAKPADVPVQQPTKFDLIINLVTAKALGLEIPATLLARADEVIE